jgi:uncharacterized protein (TIGR03382 family)
MKMKTFSLLAGASGSLLLGASAQAVITGVHVVPVSFEQGWLGEDGNPYQNFVSTVTPTSSQTVIIPDPNDALRHGRVAAAWAASLGQYKTFRVYLTVDNLGTPVNGSAGDDVALIDFRAQSLRKDLTGPGNGFFNYVQGAAGTLPTSSAGPSNFAAVGSNAQGQAAYDSYLTVGGAQGDDNSGSAIEGVAGMFAAVRGRTGAAGTVQTGATGNGFNAATTINCQNCGYLATLPINGVAYSYSSAASLAANGGLPITGMGVLIAQYTVNALDGVEGQVLAIGTGTNTSFVYTWSANIPAPGALALLGLAGVAARRRRRS